jgi:hypothetical protein
MFTLDPKLQEDTFFVYDFKVSELLLMNNANYPWFILVPRRPKVAELTDLSFEDQIEVLSEINIVADLLQTNFQPHKLNIANLGNVVRQLHIHVIARFQHDLVFPNPVWGSASEPYETKDAQELVKKIQTQIKAQELILK